MTHMPAPRWGSHMLAYGVARRDRGSRDNLRRTPLTPSRNRQTPSFR